MAALAIVDKAGTPLLLRTYTSPPEVLRSGEAPLQAHLYVGPEDIIKMHFLLFSSLDRCEELTRMSQQQAQVSTDASTRRGGDPTATPTAAGGSTVSSPGAAASVTSAAGTASARDPTARVALSASSCNPYQSIPPATGGGSSTVATTSAGRWLGTAADPRFVGKLIHSYRFISYGFSSVTGIRTLLVTVGAEAPPDAMQPLCRAVYECASAALCNPFRTPVQSWRAQQALMAAAVIDMADADAEEAEKARKASAQRERTNSEDADGGALRRAAASIGGGGSSVPVPTGGVEMVSRWLGLPQGAYEHSWPRPAPNALNLTDEPTLALSKSFNTQLETILSSFTATARSTIIH